MVALCTVPPVLFVKGSESLCLSYTRVSPAKRRTGRKIERLRARE
jgi:hypothetical protein